MTAMDTKICTPLLFVLAALIGALSIGGAEAWDTSYDNPFLYTCGGGRVLYRMFSQHDNRKEDRRWDFSCRDAPAGANPRSCYWTGYVNNWDGAMAFQCNTNYVVTGINSYHNNHREDRRFRFRCCRDTSYVTSSCHLTSYRNSYDGTLNYVVPEGRVLTGVSSVHNSHHEDRRFRFYVCSYGRR